jgi:HSP20 family protein
MESALTRADRWAGRRMADIFDWIDWPALRLLPTADEVEHMIRIEEHRADDTLVIRAEMPGIDPERDVAVTVADHMVEIRAERRVEHATEQEGLRRSEFRYGSFARTVPLPEDAEVGDVRADYHDGILEITVPCRASGAAPRRIAVAHD